MIESCGNDQRRLFKVANKLLGRVNTQVLPPTTCSLQLATDLNNFFINKIQCLRDNLSTINTTPDDAHHCLPLPARSSHRFSCFELVTDLEVTKIIKSMPPKSCNLDPLPTKVIKNIPSTFISPSLFD